MDEPPTGSGFIPQPPPPQSDQENFDVASEEHLPATRQSVEAAKKEEESALFAPESRRKRAPGEGTIVDGQALEDDFEDPDDSETADPGSLFAPRAHERD